VDLEDEPAVHARRLERGTVVFLGGGPLRDRLREQVSAEAVSDRVRFVAPVPPDRLLPVTAGATVGVSLLQATCRNHEYALPNKLFEYLMAGLPVVVSDLPEMGGLAREYDVGRVVPPEDPAVLAEVLSELIDRPELRERLVDNRIRLLDRYAWERAEDTWVETLERIRASQSISSTPSNPTA
jgi:glycosyltransferase involved in cell wall biosynthesis